MAASRAGRAVLEHDVGELVVAVHEPGDVVDGPVRPQPRRGLVEARQLAALDALEERRPPVHLALVEPVGPPEVGQALGPPVDVAEQRDPLDELEGEAAPLLEVGVEGRRPLAAGGHRGPAVDEAHEVEGPAEHRLVGAHGDGLGVGHVRPVERLDDPPLAHDAVVARRGRARRRDAHGAVQVAPAQLVDLVLAAPGDVAVLQRRPHPEALGVEPGGQLVDVGDRRHLRLERGSSVALTGSPPPAPGTWRISPGRPPGAWAATAWARCRRSPCSRAAPGGPP